jgi:hypothetical protein
MRISIIIMVLWLLSACNSNSGKNSLELENLKGDIKSIKEYWLLEAEGAEKAKKVLVYENFYNSLGYITESLEHDLSDSIVEKIIYNYDEAKRLLSKQSFNANNELKWRLDYSYNEKDSLATIKLLLNNNTELNSTQYRFVNNEILNPIKESKFQFGENYYDNSGNLSESKYSSNSSSVKYKYSKKLLTEALHFNAENKLEYKDTYRYDNNNNLTEKSSILSSGKAKEIQKCEYVYDSKGNWIKKQEYNNNKKLNPIEREIEYY